MKKVYQTPSINTIKISSSNILCSSLATRYTCNSNCMYWLTCKDIRPGKGCLHKRSKR